MEGSSCFEHKQKKRKHCKRHVDAGGGSEEAGVSGYCDRLCHRVAGKLTAMRVMGVEKP